VLLLLISVELIAVGFLVSPPEPNQKCYFDLFLGLAFDLLFAAMIINLYQPISFKDMVKVLPLPPIIL